MNTTETDHKAFTFSDGKLRSLLYDDIYFDRTDGHAESQYTFVTPNNIPQRLRQSDLTLCELGFGSGLNFLTTVDEIQKSKSSVNHQLTYIAVEKYPLSTKDILKTLKNFSSISYLSRQLVKNYPLPLPGFHQIDFATNIRLVLYIGDITQFMTQLFLINNVTVDAWYLDGFNPKHNPEMWSSDLFQMMAGKSSPGATISTYSAAGFVRRGLIAVGFDMKKLKGFGCKREMLSGTFTVDKSPRANLTSKGWLSPPCQYSKPQSVAVIGAGIAGCMTANFLAQAGLKVTLFERTPGPGNGASGNTLGLFGLPTQLQNNTQARFLAKAYLYFKNKIQSLPANAIDLINSGSFHILNNDQQKQKGLLLTSKDYPCFQNLDNNTDAVISPQLPDTTGRFFRKEAGALSPFKLCHYLLAQHPVLLDAIFNSTVAQITPISGKKIQVQYLRHNKSQEQSFDAVVLCTAHSANLLQKHIDMNIQPVSGQVSYLPDVASINNSKPIVGAGYLLPTINGRQVFGASFHRSNTPNQLSDNDHKTNLEKLNQLTGQQLNLKDISGGRFQTRYFAQDRLPIVGPVYDHDFFESAYADLDKGKKISAYPHAQYIDNLFVNFGFGSHGIISSAFCANLVTNQIIGKPNFIDHSILNALSPGRFIISRLKKQK